MSLAPNSKDPLHVSKSIKIHKRQKSSLNVSESSQQSSPQKASFFLNSSAQQEVQTDRLQPQKSPLAEKSRTVTATLNEQKLQQEVFQKRMLTQQDGSSYQGDNIRLFSVKKASEMTEEEIELKMEQIKLCHGKIMNFVKNFEDHINSILQKQEGDFEIAFKGHCFHVKNEVKMLKKVIQDLESMQKVNQTIKDLKQKVEFFQNEALSYSVLLEGSKKQNEILKQRVESLTQEKKFLEKNLKMTKKQNRYLSANLSNQSNTQQLSLTYKPQTPRESKSPAQLMLSSGRPETGHLTEENEILEEQVKASQSSSSTRPRSVDQRNSQIYQNQQRQLEFFQNKYKSLLKSRTQAMMQKSDLEEVFLDCINEVRKLIARRKKIKIQEVNLKDLRTLDKQTLLELFLTNEQVVIQIYESLFPHRAPQIIQEQGIRQDKSQSRLGGSRGFSRGVKQGKVDPKPPLEKSSNSSLNRLVSPRVERGMLMIKTPQ